MPWHVALLWELSPTLMELATVIYWAQTTRPLMHMLILGHTVLWQPSRDEFLPSVCFTRGTLGYTGQMSGTGEIAQLVNYLLHKVRTQVQSQHPREKLSSGVLVCSLSTKKANTGSPLVSQSSLRWNMGFPIPPPPKIRYKAIEEDAQRQPLASTLAHAWIHTTHMNYVPSL